MLQSKTRVIFVSSLIGFKDRTEADEFLPFGSMKKVLRILNRFNLGGPVYNASYLSADLSPDFTTLLVGGPPEEGEADATHIPESLGVKPRVLSEMQRSLNMGSDWRSYRQLRQVIREFRPDIVHTHASKAGAVGRLAALHEGVAIRVHTFHGHVFSGYFGAAKSTFYQQLERQLARKTSSIIAISEEQKRELCEVYKVCRPEQTTVIPLGFDLERFTLFKEEKRQQFRQSYKLNDNDLAIGIIGRLVPIKNHSLFLQALSDIPSTYKGRIQAFIIGDGPLRSSLEEEARQLGLMASDRIKLHFTSWVQDVSTVLPGLDMVVLSSNNEGTPVSLIEAQASGVPVVSTQVGGVCDTVLDQVSGLLVPAANRAKLSEAILRIANDPNMALDFQREGMAFAQKRFSRERLASDMRRHYESLL